jgi:HEAT repeat protein
MLEVVLVTSRLVLALFLLMMQYRLTPAQKPQLEVAPHLPSGLGGETPEELASQLKSSDVATRREAAQSLYRLRWNAKPAIPALTKALKDPDNEVRGFAAACFRFLGPPIGNPREAVPLLAEMIRKDPVLDNRRASAATFRMLTVHDKDFTKESGRTLLDAVADEDKYIRLHVAITLVIHRNGQEKALKALEELFADNDDEIRDELVAAMEEIGKLALPLLMTSLRAKNSLTRETAVLGVGKLIASFRRQNQEISPEMITLLTTALGDSDDKVIAQAIYGLSKVGRPAREAIPRIAKCLEHRNPEVRYHAAIGLSEFGDSAKFAIPAIENALTDGDPLVRVGSARALGKLVGLAALPALEKAQSDSSREVRLAVVETLAGIKTEGDAKVIVPPLVKAFSDKEMAVRIKAVESLVLLGPAGQAGIADVAVLLQDPDEWVRGAAAKAIGEFGTAGRKAIPKLTNALGDRSWVVRCRVAESLGKLAADGPTVVPALIGALKDESAGVRMWAAWALGRFGAEAIDAKPRLTELLKDSDEGVRDRAAAALERIVH